MTYISEDTKWYLADIVMECQVEGNPQNVVHINTLLIRSDSPEEALERAESLGKDEENSYLNPTDQQVTWFYRGLRELSVITEDLEDGAELMYEERVGVSPEELQGMVRERSQFSVFQPLTDREPSYPDYASKEIVQEAKEWMRAEYERRVRGMVENN